MPRMGSSDSDASAAAEGSRAAASDAPRILGHGDRARRGASGALYPRSASAGLNPRPRPDGSGQLPVRSDEGRVPRDTNLRTPSGPEGSSGKRALVGAVGTPGRSHRPVTRRVHPGSTAGGRAPLLLPPPLPTPGPPGG